MTARVVVLDASVLLKWVLESADEEERDLALGIREAWLSGRLAIVLPSLWAFEAGSILGLREPGLAVRLMRILLDYDFEEEPVVNVYERTLDLMRTFKVTFYDAVYHAVAIRHSGVLVTADNAYFKKTVRAGHVATLAKWIS